MSTTHPVSASIAPASPRDESGMPITPVSSTPTPARKRRRDHSLALDEEDNTQQPIQKQPYTPTKQGQTPTTTTTNAFAEMEIDYQSHTTNDAEMSTQPATQPTTSGSTDAIPAASPARSLHRIGSLHRMSSFSRDLFTPVMIQACLANMLSFLSIPDRFRCFTVAPHWLQALKRPTFWATTSWDVSPLGFMDSGTLVMPPIFLRQRLGGLNARYLNILADKTYLTQFAECTRLQHLELGQSTFSWSAATGIAQENMMITLRTILQGLQLRTFKCYDLHPILSEAIFGDPYTTPDMQDIRTQPAMWSWHNTLERIKLVFYKDARTFISRIIHCLGQGEYSKLLELELTVFMSIDLSQAQLNALHQMLQPCHLPVIQQFDVRLDIHTSIPEKFPLIVHHAIIRGLTNVQRFNFDIKVLDEAESARLPPDVPPTIKRCKMLSYPEQTTHVRMHELREEWNTLAALRNLRELKIMNFAAPAPVAEGAAVPAADVGALAGGESNGVGGEQPADPAIDDAFAQHQNYNVSSPNPTIIQIFRAIGAHNLPHLRLLQLSLPGEVSVTEVQRSEHEEVREIMRHMVSLEELYTFIQLPATATQEEGEGVTSSVLLSDPSLLPHSNGSDGTFHFCSSLHLLPSLSTLQLLRANLGPANHSYVQMETAILQSVASIRTLKELNTNLNVFELETLAGMWRSACESATNGRKSKVFEDADEIEMADVEEDEVKEQHTIASPSITPAPALTTLRSTLTASPNAAPLMRLIDHLSSLPSLTFLRLERWMDELEPEASDDLTGMTGVDSVGQAYASHNGVGAHQQNDEGVTLIESAMDESVSFPTVAHPRVASFSSLSSAGTKSYLHSLVSLHHLKHLELVEDRSLFTHELLQFWCAPSPSSASTPSHFTHLLTFSFFDSSGDLPNETLYEQGFGLLLNLPCLHTLKLMVPDDNSLMGIVHDANGTGRSPTLELTVEGRSIDRIKIMKE